MPKNGPRKHFANTVPEIVEGEIWPIEQRVFFHALGSSRCSVSSRADLI